MRHFLLLPMLLLASCAHEPVMPPGPAFPMASVASSPTAVPHSNLLPHQHEEMTALIAETLRVLRTPEFDRNLRAVEGEFGSIARSAFGSRLPAATVADLMAGRDPRYSFYPATVQWKPGRYSTTDASGLISLTPDVQQDWRSENPRIRSLAINSLAHELSHTLSSRPGALQMVFTDSGYLFGWVRGSPPIASYTIGAVAQCSWLDERGLMQHGLSACLRCYGIRKFTPNREKDCPGHRGAGLIGSQGQTEALAGRRP